MSSFLILNQITLAEKNQITSLEQSDIAAMQSIELTQWKRMPGIRIVPCDLENKSRYLDLQITGDSNGKIIDVKILQSTSLDHLDQKIVKAVFASQFRPTGNTITATQAFHLEFNGHSTAQCAPKYKQSICTYLFESEVLKKQILKQQTSFQYCTVPDFSIAQEMLHGQNRSIYFSFQLSRKDQVSHIKIIKSSGLNQIDTQVVFALMSASITSEKKWWQLFKVTHQDHIHFDLNQCTQNTPK